jgi:hypothetical protein
MTLLVIPLLAIVAWTAYNYSKQPPDPDWGYFHLQGFTGSKWGKDFEDIKSPLVHWVNLVFTKVFGKYKTVSRVRFLEYFVYGSVGAVYFLATGNFGAALLYLVMVNTPWLWAFTGNVSQFPAAMIMLGFAFPPLAPLFWGFVVMYEPKMILPYMAMAVIYGWWIATFIWGVIAVILVLYLWKFQKEYWGWCVEAFYTMPKDMDRKRKGLYSTWVTWWMANAMLYISPIFVLAVWYKPDILFWIPVIVYLLFIARGRVVRPHHVIQIIPWIAVAGIPFPIVLLFVLVDFFASGFYLGDWWQRHYVSLRDAVYESKNAGLWLKDKPGSIYVFGMHSEVYVWAEKPVPYGFCMQIEVRESSKRVRDLQREFRINPPNWVCETPSPNVLEFGKNGFQLITKGNMCKIWRRMR